MPRKDTFHDVVKKALIADGWTITHDPLHLGFGGFDFYVDLGAERLLGAEKDGRLIAVEIKSFSGVSALTEFHAATGQFLNYRIVLAATEPDRSLYLAVPEEVYVAFFDTPFGRLAREEHQLRMIIFDDVKEVIVRWIEETNSGRL